MNTDTENPKIQKVQKNTVGWSAVLPDPSPGTPEVPTPKSETDPSRFSSTKRFIEDRQRTFYGRPPLDILSRFLALFSTSAFLFVLPQASFRQYKTALLKQHKGLLRESMQHQLAQCPVMFIKFSRHSSFPAFA